MKQDNKKLYESIMTSVAKEVKKVLNEEENNSDIDTCINNIKEVLNRDYKNYLSILNTPNKFYNLDTLIQDKLWDIATILENMLKISMYNSNYNIKGHIVPKETMSNDLKNVVELLKKFYN